MAEGCRVVKKGVAGEMSNRIVHPEAEPKVWHGIEVELMELYEAIRARDVKRATLHCDILRGLLELLLGK